MISLLTSVIPHRRQLDFHRPLFPQEKDLLAPPLRPSLTICGFHVKVPQQSRQNETHLEVGQVATNTVAWSNGERLKARSDIIRIWRRRAMSEPAVWVKGFWKMKVFRRAVCAPMRVDNNGLANLSGNCPDTRS